MLPYSFSKSILKKLFSHSAGVSYLVFLCCGANERECQDAYLMVDNIALESAGPGLDSVSFLFLLFSFLILILVT